ncbi:alpha/beta hydrolase [Lacticaseibacillus brantae]|uniref:Carboxylesterase n=1 Tax=Lacticaseibacillus brantae DSM 23927 TaxID=1423727 RepID=A0A0R2AYE1_9LACO|nr:alpha/beta fold hydrolase [Lacticaseibacillus brantae]KRM72381.1 carboxylesterase [Lacticaseibacillus brantae DSM 23927]
MFRQPQPIEYPGGKTGVLLLHAYTGSPNDMNKLAHRLADAGYGVSVPLLSGHGTLEPLDILAASPTTWWAQTQASLADLQTKYAQVFVFGLSLGGIFAMKALETDPTLRGGGVFSSPIIAGVNHLPAGFRQYAQYMYRLADSPGHMTAVNQQLPAQLGAIEQFSQTVANQLGQLSRPIFIGQAGADELIDASRAYQLRDAIKQPVDFHWYPDAKHVITVNSAHHQLEIDVLNYLQQEEVPA